MSTEELQKLNQQSVLVGVSGRIESLVALYLLKKQGYKCMAVSFEFHGKEHLEKGHKQRLDSRCHVDDIYRVKEICEELEIPFYVVDARDAFKAKVMEYVVASRMNGTQVSSCSLCNKLKLELLVEKANKLNARFISSGHYAKVTHSQSTNEYYLHSSVDTKNDQSHFLATINQEQLERIILPLADMRREDVLKIGEGMGLKFEADYQQANECFINDKNLGFYIDRTVAKLLIPEGEMINEKESRSITALAEGAHHYYLGESHLRPVPNISIDKDHVVTKKDFLKSQVFIGAKSETLCQSITLERFHFINRMDLTKPCKCFMRITSGAAAIPVMLLFKTNKIILVQLIEPIKLHLNKGMSISFYYKKSAGTKLIGAGVIVSGGEIEIEDRIYTKNDLPQDDDEIARLNAKKLELNFKF